MNWYLNREAGRVNHRGQDIPEGKKIYLSQDQAKLHNRSSEKVAKCSAPTDQKEAAVLADWEIFQSKDLSEADSKPDSKVERQKKRRTKKGE